MFAAPEYLCMVLPSAPPALYGPVTPYPCPAYRSPVCLPGYNPSHRIAWKTAELRHHGRKSSFKGAVKAQNRKSFSIESILSEDKSEANDKGPQRHRRPLPSIAAGQVHTGGSSQIANFNFWKDGVHGQTKDGFPKQDGTYHVHRFEDVMRSYNANIKVSNDGDSIEPSDVSRQIDAWRLSAAAHHHKSKRIRTIFTSEQLQRLEKVFEDQQYMVGAERLLLASELQLSEAQVKVWFQNRRIKWRKESHEKNQAKLADYRSRRDEIRRKLGLSQRRRLTPDDIKRKRVAANSDVTTDEPIATLDTNDTHE